MNLHFWDDLDDISFRCGGGRKGYYCFSFIFFVFTCLSYFSYFSNMYLLSYISFSVFGHVLQIISFLLGPKLPVIIMIADLGLSFGLLLQLSAITTAF